MSLEGGKVLCYGEDGKIEKILHPNEKIFTIGYYMSCDVIHEHPEVKGIHCEIACDSFGRITVKNYCETHPIIVNGAAVAGTRPLLSGSTIEVMGKQFRWEYEPPQKEGDSTQTTPDAKANKVQPAPNSEPSAPVFRTLQKRLTVHSFAYGLNSNREETTENPSKCTIIQPLQMNTTREIVENQSSTNLIDMSLLNKENCSPKRRLSNCSHSDLVFTSYSPRTGINTPKGFACVTPVNKTPKSLYTTPRSALSEHNQSTNSRDFITPKGKTPKLTATSMYLIDLTTPLKSSRTPIKRTPLLKSALKNSAKGSAKGTAKKSTLSGSNGTNIQGRKIVLETPGKKKSVSKSPKKSRQTKQQCAEESNIVLLESIVEQCTINSSINMDSVNTAEESSVIEISSDGTPNRFKEKKQLKTPQLVASRAIITSARKVKTAEKDFAKKIKNNIERISENLSTISNIGNIRNRRSSFPVISTVVGKQSLPSQSTAEKLPKANTTPSRILTTSTPFRSRKSLSKMIQSTPLKTPQQANLRESFRRHSCISSNQTTPKVAAKTPRRSVMESQDTKTPKKVNSCVLFIEKFDKSLNQIKENEEDVLNSTFTVDEEEGQNDGNKTVNKNNKSEILGLKPLDTIEDFVTSDALKDEKKHIQTIIDEEIQGRDIAEQTNISKTSEASINGDRFDQITKTKEIKSSEISDNPLADCVESPRKFRRSASFTIESPKEVQISENIITRKQIAQDTPLDTLTDLKGLKQILKTPRTLSRTPAKEVPKTPKVEKSGSKGETGFKRIMKSPINTPKGLVVKQLFDIPKVTSEENLGVKEILKTKNIAKSSEEPIDIKEIKKTPELLNTETLQVMPVSKTGDILSSQKNEFDLSLRRSASFTIKTSTDAETSVILEDNKSFLQIANPTENKYNNKTPKKYPVDMEAYSELQSGDILKISDISNTSVAKIRRPSTFNIETPEKFESLEIPGNWKVDATIQQNYEKSEIPSSLISANHDEPTNLQIPKKTICLENATEVQSSEIVENVNFVSNTPALGREHIKRKALKTRSSKMETPITEQTPKKVIYSKNPEDDQISDIPVNANIQITPTSGLESGERKLRSSLVTKTKTPKKLKTPKKTNALQADADAPIEQINEKLYSSTVAEMQISEIAEKLDILSTPVTTHEPVQRKLRRSNTFHVDEVTKKIQTPEIQTTLTGSAEIQSCKILEKSDIPSISASGREPTEKRLLRSSITKMPTNLLTPKIPITLKDYVEAQNIDVPVGQTEREHQTILKAEIPTNQTMETSFALEESAENKRDTIPQNSDILSAPLVAFKPVLCKIRKSKISKMKTTATPPNQETSIGLDDDAQAQSTEISENVNIPNTSGDQVQNDIQTSTISEVETSINLPNLETSVVLEDDAETQRTQNPENILSTSIGQDQSKLQTSSISKDDEEIQRGGISKHSDISKTPISSISKTIDSKRHSFMVVGHKVAAVEMFRGSKKEIKRHTTGSLVRKTHSERTNDDNLPSSKNLNTVEELFTVIGKSVFTPTTIPSNDNTKLEPNMEDKDKSFSSLNEDIKSSDISKEKPTKAEPEKLFKSATFIIDSLKRPNIVNSSSEKGLTDSGSDYTLTEDSEQLFNSPKELNQTPDLKQSQKLLKTHLQTPNPVGVKELFNSPKPLKDINFVGIKELMKTPKATRDSEDIYHGLNDLLKTPKDSIIRNETPNQYLKGDDTGELGDYETLLIEEESYPPSPTSSQTEDERISQVKHERVLRRKYKSYPTTPIIGLKSSSTKPRKSVEFFTEIEEDLCCTISSKTLMGEFQQDQMEVREISDSLKDSSPITPIVGLKRSLSKTRKSVDFYIETEEDEDSSESLKTSSVEEYLQDQLEGYKTSDIITDVTSEEELLKTTNYVDTPKSQKEEKILSVKEPLNAPKDLEKTTVFIGVKELLNTPKDESSDDIRELGLKGLMKTPTKTPKPVRIKELFITPKDEKVENFVGVKELMNEPKNVDQTVVMLGVKELLNTPKNENSNEIRELGLKKLMKTPTKTPKPVRIKELFHSPKQEKEENLVGVKELMHTPKNFDQTTVFIGVKELVKTPENIKSPRLLGIKQMFNSSKTVQEACLGGIKELMKTPESSKDADINLTGVKELLETPKNDANTEDFPGLPKMFNTPHHSRLINKKDEDVVKTQIVELDDPEIDQITLSPKNLSPLKQMSDRAFKTPSAKMVMVLGTPQSVNIRAEKLNASVGPPPLYDLKENMEEIEEVFPSAVLGEENEALSAEDAFDKLNGKSFIRKSYGRSRMPQKNSSFITQFNEEKEAELSQPELEWVENESLVLSSEEIDENSRDAEDVATAFSMSGINTLERDDEPEAIEQLQNSQDGNLINKVIIDIEIVSPETSTPKKTETNVIYVENHVHYKKDDSTEKEDENFQIDSNVIQNKSTADVNEKLLVEKNKETDIVPNDIALGDDEFAATPNIKLRRGRSKNVELLQKQELEDNLPKQIKTRRGRRKDDVIEEKLEITASSEELVEAVDSTKMSLNEFKKDVKIQIDRKDSDDNDYLNIIKKSENILETKVTRRETRKRKVSNTDTNKEETFHENPEKNLLSAPQSKRTTRRKRNLKTENLDDQKSISIDDDKSQSTVEIARKGRRGKDVKFVEVKVTDNIFEEVLEVEEPIKEDRKDIENEEEIKVPKPTKKTEHISNTALLTTDSNEDIEQDDDKKENISNNLSPSNEANQPFSLPILIKTRGRRNAATGSAKTKTGPVKKRKSDSDSDEAVVPLKRMVRKRGGNIKEGESQQLNLETKVVTKQQADNSEFEEEALSPSEGDIAKEKVESVVVRTENFDKTTEIACLKDETKNFSENIENLNTKKEITSPRKGRAKRKADSNLNSTQQGSSSIESEAPPVRRGRSRRKAENIEPQEQIPERKAESTPSKRGLRRKVEDLVENPQESNEEPKAELTPPQNRRARSRVDNALEEPKAEMGKTSNLLNMSADELTPIKPANLRDVLEEKENASTPKTQPKGANALEFKTPMSAAPRARRVLRSNSTSVQVLTPVLKEQNQHEIIVIDDSVNKIETSLPAVASTRTRGGRRLNPTKSEVETSDVEKLETSLNGPPVPKTGKPRGRPRINSTKEEVQILNESQTSENATSGKTRGRNRINSMKAEVKIATANVEQTETSGKAKSKKKANIAKEEMKALDIEVEQSEVPEIAPTTASGTRTRGRKKVNSTKEEVEPVNPSDTSENIPQAAASGGRRGRGRINSIKEQQLKDPKEQAETTETIPPIAASGRTRGRAKINSTKEEKQIEDPEISENILPIAATAGRTRARRKANSANEEVPITNVSEEQPEENLVGTRTRTTRRKKAS